MAKDEETGAQRIFEALHRFEIEIYCVPILDSCFNCSWTTAIGETKPIFLRFLEDLTVWGVFRSFGPGSSPVGCIHEIINRVFSRRSSRLRSKGSMRLTKHYKELKFVNNDYTSAPNYRSLSKPSGICNDQKCNYATLK